MSRASANRQATVGAVRHPDHDEARVTTCGATTTPLPWLFAARTSTTEGETAANTRSAVEAPAAAGANMTTSAQPARHGPRLSAPAHRAPHRGIEFFACAAISFSSHTGKHTLTLPSVGKQEGAGQRALRSRDRILGYITAFSAGDAESRIAA
jgi:hypothetical protein